MSVRDGLSGRLTGLALRRRRSRLVLGAASHAAEIIVGSEELLVLGRVRRDISRGAALLLAILEVTAQAGLTLGLVLALQLVRDLLQNLLIGVDALRLDRAAGWGVVAGG